MDLDGSTDPETRSTRPAGPSMAPPGHPATDAEPTLTLSRRDRPEVEAGLLFGLLAMANGLIEPRALTRALAAWSLDDARPLREEIVEQEGLDDPAVATIAGLVESHLARHQGIAWKALIALGDAVRFRIDPRGIADPELRAILAGFADRPDHAAGRPEGPDGLGLRYEILGPHARGGLGVVSLARDRELRREVAVKEIRGDCADNPDYRARFLREAEVTGRLEHPGIVPVYGMGYHDDGRPYYIMRFIRGETLKAAIARLHKPAGGGDGEDSPGEGDRPDLRALVGRFVDACHAVAYAHHRKILHRDLKPINIMLGPFGETLVVDWGLAKSFGAPGGPSESPITMEDGTLRPESGSELTPTRDGSQVGTTGYMSPEQDAGRLAELGPPSDIYSLGVTLHYLATGRPPFEGAGRAEYSRRVREGDFPRPRQVNPAVPRALEAVCLKCMALRPIDRYQAVGELIDDLERWRAGSPVRAYPEPWPDRLARWSRRHRTALAAAAVLLACTTVGLAILAERGREETRRIEAEKDVAESRRVEAVEQRTAAEDRRKFALGLLKATLREVAGADLAFLARSEGFRRRMADELVASYRNLATDDPKDRRVRFDLAQAEHLAANIGRAMGEHARPGTLYTGAIARVRSLGDGDLPGEDVGLELATLLDDHGDHLRLLGKPKPAEAEYREGLEVLRLRPGPDPSADDRRRAEARLQVDLSGALGDLGRLEPAREATARALELLKPSAAGAKVDRTEGLLLVLARLNRGYLWRIGGQSAEAAPELAEAARLARALCAAVTDPDTRLVLAAVRNEQGRLILDSKPGGPDDGAMRAFEEALSHLLPLYEDLPRSLEVRRALAVTLNGRGACLLAAKRCQAARDDFTAAGQLMGELIAAIPDNFHNLGELGLAFANLGRVSAAEGKADAVDALLKAIEYHSTARRLNPESPVEGKFEDEARFELIKLTRKATGEAP